MFVALFLSVFIQDDMKLRSVAERAVAFSGTEGYTVELTVDEVEAILKEALQK